MDRLEEELGYARDDAAAAVTTATATLVSLRLRLAALHARVPDLVLGAGDTRLFTPTRLRADGSGGAATAADTDESSPVRMYYIDADCLPYDEREDVCAGVAAYVAAGVRTLEAHLEQIRRVADGIGLLHGMPLTRPLHTDSKKRVMLLRFAPHLRHGTITAREWVEHANSLSVPLQGALGRVAVAAMDVEEASEEPPAARTSHDAVEKEEEKVVKAEEEEEKEEEEDGQEGGEESDEEIVEDEDWAVVQAVHEDGDADGAEAAFESILGEVEVATLPQYELQEAEV